jgi:galactokinase
VTIRWFAPGRIEVFGKHTDYAGGRSLVCAVPRGVTIEAQPSDDGLVVVEDQTVGERAEFSMTGAGDAEGWHCYPGP